MSGDICVGIREADVQRVVPPLPVFDYVTSPKSWPQWLPSSHDIYYERSRLWIGLTHMSVTGPIVVQYVCDVVDGGTKFTRTVRTPRDRRQRRRR